tara:strand:+ start:159 stop:755 length:597 start_codon:yes stop_codon:yes gene_type:complete
MPLYEKIARELLEDKYVSLRMQGHFKIEEDLENDITKIHCAVAMTGSQDKNTMIIEGKGKGPVDAFFKSIRKELSSEYTSLNTFRFKEFSAYAELNERNTRASSSSATVEIAFVVQNGRGEDLIFRDKSTSMNKSSVKSVLKAVEYFVNIEKAVRLLHAAIKDAKERNRGDLVGVYTLKLAELVNTTSYEKILKEEGG